MLKYVQREDRTKTETFERQERFIEKLGGKPYRNVTYNFGKNDKLLYVSYHAYLRDATPFVKAFLPVREAKL